MEDYFHPRKKYAYPDEYFTVLPKRKEKDLEEVEKLEGFSIQSWSDTLNYNHTKKSRIKKSEWDAT